MFDIFLDSLGKLFVFCTGKLLVNFVKIVDFVVVYSGESVVETKEPINTKTLNKNIIARRQRPLFSYYLPLTILFGT